MSATGLCPECWTTAVDTNAKEISEHRGPYFEKWRASMAACVGGVLLDEARARE